MQVVRLIQISFYWLGLMQNSQWKYEGILYVWYAWYLKCEEGTVAMKIQLQKEKHWQKYALVLFGI